MFATANCVAKLTFFMQRCPFQMHSLAPKWAWNLLGFSHRRTFRHVTSSTCCLTRTARISRKILPQILFANTIFALGLYAAKNYILSFDVGVFWVLMRVLACGGVGTLIWVGSTGGIAHENVEVRRIKHVCRVKIIRYFLVVCSWSIITTSLPAASNLVHGSV